MIEMQPVDENLKRARAMLEEMENFLLSNEIFWPLDASAGTWSDQFPKLSVGAFLLTLDQLQSQANEMSADQVNQYQKLRESYLEVSGRWPANVGKKAVAEMRQRANLWKAYLQELADNPRMAEVYPQEVKNRVVLERLKTAARGTEGVEQIRARLGELDSLLRPRFQAGGFVWDPRLLGTYTGDRYWFLAGHPRK